MIKDALEFLVQIGRKSQDCQTIGLPGNRIALVRGDMIELYDQDRQPRSVCVQTLSSFVRWVKAVGYGRDVQVVVSDTAVTTTVDIEEHICDRCMLPLQPSAAMNALQAWSVQPATVPEVVRMLRTALDGTYNKQHLATFKRVDFQRVKSTMQKVSHAGESLGRSIEKMAQSTDGEVPEVLTFDVDVFELDVGFAKRQVQYAVDVNCDSERVAIFPIGDCVTAARKAIKADLVSWLDQALEDCLVLAGTVHHE